MRPADVADPVVGERWIWTRDGSALVMKCTKVTKRTFTLEAPAGWTITFHEKEKALSSAELRKQETTT